MPVVRDSILRATRRLMPVVRDSILSAQGA